MSASTADTAALLGEAAVSVCWRQWRVLTSARFQEGEAPSSIIDPEALVLLSLPVRHRERRLQDLVAWWAVHGSSLLSVQRTRTLLTAFPQSVAGDLAWFAQACVAAGDRRWQPLVRQCADRVSDVAARPGKGPDVLELLPPPTLLLRLRAGFGVGVKADLLAFLIGSSAAASEREVWAPAETIAAAITYSSASVRRAASEMVLARFLEASTERPTQYCADARAWGDLLGLPTLPPWKPWVQVFAFLAESLEWAEPSESLQPIVQASRARDIAERYQRVLRRSGIRTPDVRAFPGEAYGEAFAGLAAEVARWVAANV